ncbi:MAG: hypothetical protein M1814_005154 [Vezdaea aestivalis]|nr:MAG: hypothetical protein M1814_005154 [Vezdaea aestivalis]
MARAPKIAVVFWTQSGRNYEMAKLIRDGIVDAGGSADIFRVKEAIQVDKEKVWAKESEIDPAHLAANYDAFLMGIPTRYGTMPAQWRTFWDSSGSQWLKGSFYGKYAGAFTSTGTMGGGQETTILSAVSTIVHHGMIFVPLGYAGEGAFQIMGGLNSPRGGSPWGSGSFVSSQIKHDITEDEKALIKIQGKEFYKKVSLVNFPDLTPLA